MKCKLKPPCHTAIHPFGLIYTDTKCWLASRTITNVLLVEKWHATAYFTLVRFPLPLPEDWKYRGFFL